MHTNIKRSWPREQHLHLKEHDNLGHVSIFVYKLSCTIDFMTVKKCVQVNKSISKDVIKSLSMMNRKLNKQIYVTADFHYRLRY